MSKKNLKQEKVPYIGTGKKRGDKKLGDKKLGDKKLGDKKLGDKKLGDKKPSTLVLFNKPFQVLSQFTDSSDRRTLKHFIGIADIYAAGRLDYDSEGLLLLTNNGKLANKITSPAKKTSKTYWVQVEGEVKPNDLNALRSGVELKDGLTQPAKAELIDAPKVWPRSPPIRERKNIPTSWLSISITEGRNRQVRRMTAHIGFPTLRLIRYRIGNWTIDGINSGEYLQV